MVFTNLRRFMKFALIYIFMYSDSYEIYVKYLQGYLKRIVDGIHIDNVETLHEGIKQDFQQICTTFGCLKNKCPNDSCTWLSMYPESSVREDTFGSLKMNTDFVNTSCTLKGEAEDNAESKIDIWSVWKECESMLINNSYMMESLSVQISPKITQIATEMYNRIVTMFNEMETLKDGERRPINEVRKHVHICKRKPPVKEDSEWEYEPPPVPERTFISLEYKKKVVEMAKAHPRWSLETLQKRGGSLLKKKSYLKNWEAEIAAGGNKFDKYEAINHKTFERVQEALENVEEVTTADLKQWALESARELNCRQFVASAGWLKKFKLRYDICQRKITR